MGITILVRQLRAEIEQLKRAARYCEQIDATPENQRETMLYDLALERDHLWAENAELLAALQQAQMALTGYVPAHRNDITSAAIERAQAAINQAMTKEQP